jgi:excisionase family DNA binding protein
MKPLLTPQQAAEQLGVTRGTVYELVKAGTLRAVRLGDGPKPRLRIRPEDLDRYVNASLVVPDRSTSSTHADECAAIGIEPDHVFS